MLGSAFWKEMAETGLLSLFVLSGIDECGGPDLAGSGQCVESFSDKIARFFLGLLIPHRKRTTNLELERTRGIRLFT